MVAKTPFRISDLECVSGPVVAHVLGLSDRQVRNLTHDKVLVQVSKGKYDLAAAVQAYNAYSSDGHVSLSARQAVYKQQERRLRLENDIREGAVLSRDHVNEVTGICMATVAQLCDALVGRLPPAVVGMTEARLIGAKVRTEVRAIRQAASDHLKALRPGSLVMARAKAKYDLVACAQIVPLPIGSTSS